MKTPPQNLFDTAAATLKVLAHPTRLRIVQHLGNKATASQSVTQIFTALDLPQAIASQHLLTMKDRNLLKSNKVGTQVFYSIAALWVVDVVKLLDKQVA